MFVFLLLALQRLEQYQAEERAEVAMGLFIPSVTEICSD